MKLVDFLAGNGGKRDIRALVKKDADLKVNPGGLSATFAAPATGKSVREGADTSPGRNFPKATSATLPPDTVRHSFFFYQLLSVAVRLYDVSSRIKN